MLIVERKYAMTRMGKGLYLLPSNDGTTLWRISSYQEDGSAGNYDADGKWVPVLGTRWMIAQRPLPTQADIERAEDEHEFMWGDAWREWGVGYLTRRDAIEDALSC